MMIVEEMNRVLNGVTIQDLQILNGSHFKYPVYVSSACMNNDIMDMDLSVRSYNCLKRAGIQTVGDLVNRIDKEEDLKVFRNLGMKSAKEIMFGIFTYQFSQLSNEGKKPYLEKVLKMNGISVARK